MNTDLYHLTLDLSSSWIHICRRIQVARPGYLLTVSRRHNYYSFMSRSTCIPCIGECWGTLGHTVTPCISVDCEMFASSEATPMLFKSRRMISFQFFLGLPGPQLVALISQIMACFGILSSSILKTCPNYLSFLSLKISFLNDKI